MDHEFFEGLSQEEAHAYLKRYLEVASASTAAMLRKAQADDLDAEFSIDSIAPVLGWVSRRVEIVRLDAPADIPDRIVTAMERDHGGFRDFRDESKPLVLSAGYYFGESFVRTFPQLSWNVGQKDRAERGQPVVAGFRSGTDLPALQVAENLLLGQPARRVDETVRTAVAIWASAA